MKLVKVKEAHEEANSKINIHTANHFFLGTSLYKYEQRKMGFS